jgi:hypothetical protein
MKTKEACFELKRIRNRERDKGSPCYKNQSLAKTEVARKRYGGAAVRRRIYRLRVLFFLHGSG